MIDNESKEKEEFLQVVNELLKIFGSIVPKNTIMYYLNFEII